jgi:hypothetical protein
MAEEWHWWRKPELPLLRRLHVAGRDRGLQRPLFPQMRSPAGWLGFEWNQESVSQGVTDCVEWFPCGTITTDVGWIPTG